MTEVQALSNTEIAAVSGGSTPSIQPVQPKVVMAEDMYGNKMSIEDWMNWTAREYDPTRIVQTLPLAFDSIHDFPGGRGR